jgi:DNA-binding response OmpR family regulator
MVDDDVDLASIIAMKLQTEGFDIKTISNPEVALETVKEYKPDLILLDINMPGMNGTEYLIELRDIPDMKKVKVIFFTSMSNPWPVFKDRDNIAKDLGAVDFMEKGTDLDLVVKKIREALMKE